MCFKKKSSLSTLQTWICANEVRNSTENFTLFFSLKKKRRKEKKEKQAIILFPAFA